jgi:hypothetical protein
MNSKEIIGIVSKAFGLYFLIQAIIRIKDTILYAITILYAKEITDDEYFVLFNLTLVILEFLFFTIGAWVLISKSDYISNILTKGSTDSIQLSVSKFDLIELIVIAVGLIVLVNAIPELLNKISHFLFFNEYEDKSDRHLFWSEKKQKS